MALILLLGIFLLPVVAGASFLSSILGNDAYANTHREEAIPNSQTIALLSADISSVSTLKDKIKDNRETAVSSELAGQIVSNNALMPTASPSSGAPFCENGPYTDYEVRSGDTISLIADMYDVTPDTILSANDHLRNGGKLKVGEFILIPPCSGVEYTVAKGDTLQGIYNKHKDGLTEAEISFNDFFAYNEIGADQKIQPGEKLFIPGAKIQKETPKKISSSNIAKSTSSSKPLVDVSGYFTHPIPGAKRVRGIGSGHYGVDFGAGTGTPIHAAASGTVKTARVGSMSRTSNGGYGTYVVITHSNGTETWYAHMSKLGTSSGAQVNKGEVIGYVGSTGRSTGPHLHFEVKGAKNPF